MRDIYSTFETELSQLRGKQQFRGLREVSGRNLTEIDVQGKRYLNLSSNDYLGLGADRQVLEEFFTSFSRNTPLKYLGMAGSSSRLLTGNNQAYTDLEEYLAAVYKSEAACVFNSGYHANIGILPALSAKHDLVLSDKLNHASIIDGLKLADAHLLLYRHLDYDHLEQLLKKHRNNYRRVFIITETVFSMDGDIADLQRLVQLKRAYDAFLIVDEAHAVGVFGKTGCGICEEQGVIPELDVIVGTFGKALASLGAFAITKSLLKEYLVNKMRSLLFTTALPPVILNWNRFILKKVVGMESKRQKLQALAVRFRRELEAYSLKTGGASQIIPVIIGENLTAVNLAETLQNRGFLLFAIRPPTVPQNTARLRVSLNAEMTWQQIRSIPKAIGEYLRGAGSQESGARSKNGHPGSIAGFDRG